MMDRTTEPVIAVLGHPIAGNASQFALERAFAAMQLDWRVLSFDVKAANLQRALDGLEVLGVEGVLIDPSLSDAARGWAQARSLDGTFDILFREHSLPEPKSRIGWSLLDASGAWLIDTIREHFESRGRIIERWACMGTVPSHWSDTFHTFLKSAEKVELEPDSADSLHLIVVSLLKPETAIFDEWPRSDRSTIVIDMVGDAIPESISELGYRVLASADLQAGMLSRSVNQWTRQSPSFDVLREAIEEYSAL